MPGKRRGYRKRNYRRKGLKTKMLRKVGALVRRDISLAKDHRVSTQQWDSTVLNGTLGSPAINTDLLGLLAQGVGQTWTSGDGNLQEAITGLRINVLRLKVSGIIYPSTFTTGAPSGIVYRIIIYEDTQPLNSTPLRPFTAPTVSAPGAFGYNILQTDHMTSMINSETSKREGTTPARLRILYDKISHLNLVDNAVAKVKISINLHNAVVNYYPVSTGASSTFFALNRAYYMCIMAYDYVTNTNLVTFQGTSRVMFTN